MRIQHTPVAKAEMLIRKPVAEVFEAFINPDITSKFWFTKGSGRLESGKEIRWDWEMYGHSAQVSVKSIEENRRILVEWSGYETPTRVEWIFTARADDTTFVSITNTGFGGDGDKIVEQALESTEGFALVLAGLKAFLEQYHLAHRPGSLSRCAQKSLGPEFRRTGQTKTSADNDHWRGQSAGSRLKVFGAPGAWV